MIVVLHLCTLPLDRGPAPGAPPRPELLRLRLDPNSATVAELALLPGIGPRRAAYIAAYRAARGDRPAYARPADLERVPRIGPLTVRRLRPYLRFPPANRQAADEHR